jgi:hypothetical protein
MYRAAKERLVSEFPMGGSHEVPEMIATAFSARIEGLAGLNTREQGALAQQVADDFADRASAVSIGHSAYRNGVTPSGGQIVNALLAEASEAFAQANPGKSPDLLRLDRTQLEYWAAKGRGTAAYSARKAQLGLK